MNLSRRYLSIFPLLGFTTLALSFLLAFLNPRPGGYELSLYNDFPKIFWVLIHFTSIIGVTILLLSANEENSSLFTPGITIVVLTNILLMSLPLLLGYAANNRADVLNHIGYVRDIANTGKLSPLDFYPGMHLLQYSIEQISGVTATQAVVILNAIITVLWSAGPPLLASKLAKNDHVKSIAGAFSAILWLIYYHSYILPSVISGYLIPIIIFLHFMREEVPWEFKISFTISEIILAFFLVYLHPVTTIFMIIIFGIFDLYSKLYAFLINRYGNKEYNSQPASNMTLILLISFFTWYFSFTSFTSNISKSFFWLFGEYERSSALGESLNMIQISQLPFLELTRIILNSMGTPVAIVGLTSILIVITLYAHFKHKKLPSLFFFVQILSYLSLIIFVILMFLTSTSERHPVRLLRILVIIGICITPWWIWDALYMTQKSHNWPDYFHNHKNVFIGLMAMFLYLMVITSQINLYEHPRNGLPNQRVTYSEFSGMEWFINHRVPTSVTASVLPKYTTRFEAYFYGMQGIRDIWPNWWKADIWLPPGFYEDQWKCISEIMPNEMVYLLLSENGRIAPLRFPISVRDRAHVYTLEDWAKLTQDSSASKLYDNGGFQVWITNSDANCHY